MLVLSRLGHHSQAIIPTSHSDRICPACAKKAFSSQMRYLLTGEHVWRGFQARETSCIHPVHKEHCVAPWLICSISMRGLVGTKARVASPRNPTLGLVFIH